MQAVVGSEMPFAPGCEPMKLLAGLDVTAKAIERAAEAIGTQIAQRDQQEIGRAKQPVLPVVSKQNIPKMYVLIDGVQSLSWPPKLRGERAGSKESAHAHASANWPASSPRPPLTRTAGPFRDPDSTTYVGAIETAEEFGFRIYTEAWRRGWEWATIRVVLGDGAVWIWNLADAHFPGTIQIVDLYHARQHLWEIGALLYPQDPAAKKLWVIPMKDLLDVGDIETLVTHLCEIAATHAATGPDLTNGGDTERG